MGLKENGKPNKVSLLTGGKDPHYALGLLSAIIDQGAEVDFIANDEMAGSPVTRNKNVKYFNLRGDQNPLSPMRDKVTRVLRYYLRLFSYAARSEPKIFHILWLNKFFFIDGILLNLYYKLLGKKLCYTAHNVNIWERDGRDNRTRRKFLKMMYGLTDHIFVHSEKMSDQLVREYGINREKITIIPFGLNDVIPQTGLSGARAREKLCLRPEDKVLLFFGNIAPYKGLDCLILALGKLQGENNKLKVLIVGRIKDCEDYWEKIEGLIKKDNLEESIIKRIEYVPDGEVEVFFKSADALVLPYKHIFQSGVLFLAFNFGLPAIASDVGSLADDIIEGETGYICRAEDPEDLAKKIEEYFQSDLYRNLEDRRSRIKEYGKEKHSWDTVAEKTIAVYRGMI